MINYCDQCKEHTSIFLVFMGLKKIIPALKEKGVCVVGSALENGRPIHEIKKQEKGGLCFRK